MEINEIDLIDDIFYRHKIYDIIIDLDDNNYIVIHDDDNVWIGKEVYNFMFNELFVYNNGKVDLISDEKIKQLNEYRKKYNDSHSSSYNNVLWHHGLVVNMKYQGEYEISATGIVSCRLIAKKDFINEQGRPVKKGDLLVQVKDTNESGIFKEKMSLYIKDDYELDEILSGKHDLYNLEIDSTNKFKMTYLNDEDNEKEYDNYLKSFKLKDAIKESIKIIQQKNANREENNMIIRENVYSKMEQEYNNFIEELKKLSPEKIIEKSYEKVIKEEILSCFYPKLEEDYLISQIKTLNRSKNPLEELYRGWMDYDEGIHSILEESISYTIDNLSEKIKESERSKQKNTLEER